jgi:nitrogen fixation/metabolism regulation signal transduction histidine kinase
MMKLRIKFVVPAVAVSLAVMLGSGCSKTERQEIKAEHEVKKEQKEVTRDENYRDKEWNEAVKYANKGYAQLADFDKKVDKMEPKRAKRHLEKASKDFSEALTHLAKSEVGKDRESAINYLNSGSDALDKAYKELDEGRVDAAQLHFDEANGDFDKANAILQ